MLTMQDVEAGRIELSDLQWDCDHEFVDVIGTTVPGIVQTDWTLYPARQMNLPDTPWVWVRTRECVTCGRDEADER